MNTFFGTTLLASLLMAHPVLADEIKVGIAGPITGPVASFGQMMTNGASLAIDDINNKGGVLRNKLVAYIGDDAGDPKQGVSVANKQVGDGVNWIVGHFNSGVSIPASSVYEENGVLMITPASTNPTLTEEGKWNVFRTCGRDDQQAAVASEYLLTKAKDKKIAVIHDKTAYGQGLADALVSALAKGGKKPTFYEGLTVGEKDYSAIILKIKASGAEIVFFGGVHPEAGLLTRQMADLGVRATLMGGDGISSTEYASIAGPSAEGTLMTFPADPKRIPEASDVMKRFAEKGIDPESYTLSSYAAVQVMSEAAESINSLDPAKIAEYLHSGAKFKTILGEMSFDKKGDLSKSSFVMYTWKKQKDGLIRPEQN